MCPGPLHISHVSVSVPRNDGFHELRQAIIRNAPEDFISSRGMLEGLVKPGKLCVLVTPIDLEAPKGRLILPQVQAIRDILDHDSFCIVVKENMLTQALADLKEDPQLVVTDSQVFASVAKQTPEQIPIRNLPSPLNPPKRSPSRSSRA